ncbi:MULTISPECIES: hypothetical protein [unclassified Bradyrhizobium]|uniref:hypothetical protein n=1 Tax=unclassified Bradyrhizobium TaxID=2631580 RepID=UPI002303EDE5|nr:hypothetical protein [Bradyrhizobium sp. CCBAU 45321]
MPAALSGCLFIGRCILPDPMIGRSVNEDRADREQRGHEGQTNAEVEGGDPLHQGPPKLLRSIK